MKKRWKVLCKKGVSLVLAISLLPLGEISETTALLVQNKAVVKAASKIVESGAIGGAEKTASEQVMYDTTTSFKWYKKTDSSIWNM